MCLSHSRKTLTSIPSIVVYKLQKLLQKWLSGEVKPTQYLVKPPMLYNQVFLNTYSKPFLPVTTETKNWRKKKKFSQPALPEVISLVMYTGWDLLWWWLQIMIWNLQKMKQTGFQTCFGISAINRS